MAREYRAGGIRTHGLHVPNVALYQAEPQPVKKKRRLDRPKGEVNLGFPHPLNRGALEGLPTRQTTNHFSRLNPRDSQQAFKLILRKRHHRKP